MMKKYYPLVISFALFITMFIVSLKIPEETIRNLVENFGIFGPVLLVFLLWLTNVIAPLGATPFLFAGFYLYGSKIILLSYFAAIIASVSNFLIAHKYGRGVVRTMAGDEVLSKFDELSDRYGYKTLFFLRLVLYQQHDVISYAAGLTNFKFTPYFVISVFGMLPGAFILYILSGRFDNPLTFIAFLFIVAYVALFAYYIFGKFKRKLV